MIVSWWYQQRQKDGADTRGALWEVRRRATEPQPHLRCVERVAPARGRVRADTKGRSISIRPLREAVHLRLAQPVNADGHAANQSSSTPSKQDCAFTSTAEDAAAAAEVAAVPPKATVPAEAAAAAGEVGMVVGCGTTIENSSMCIE